MMKQVFTVLVLLCCMIAAKAQTQIQNSGWLFLMNTTKFNDKWGMHMDVQLRTNDEWDGIRSLLVRPGLTYYINGSSDVTLGYLYTPTFVNLDGIAKSSITEHRIWQQYIYKHKLAAANISHRFRLEQRFVERVAGDDFFAQRARYFVRGIIPLEKQEGLFGKGVFIAVQNEVFLNVQAKDELNGHLFDQNRAYMAAGYRFSKKMDAELGYMNQSVKGAANNTSNNIVQLAIYTRF